jgi:hypothetical protein
MSAPLPQVIPPRRSREQSEKAMRRLKIGRPDWDESQPSDGFPPLKKVDHAESEWNEASWPPSGWPEDVCLLSIPSCYWRTYKERYLIEIDCEGKSRGRIPCVFPKFHMQHFNQFFDTVDRLRVLILTTWFFSGNTSGYMNQRNTELLTFSAGLGRNTAGPLGSMLKKLSKLSSDSETLRFSLLFTYNFIVERSREKVGKPNG